MRGWRGRIGRGWRCWPGRCRPGASPGCGSSSLPAPSCGGTGTTSVAAGRAGPAAAAPDGRRRAAMSGRWCCGWRVRMSRGVTAASTASSRRSASPWRRQRSGRSSRTRASALRPAGTVRAGPGRADFLRSQAQAILALDFFTAGLLNGTKVYVLAVIEHGSRRARVLGATEHPVQSPVVQQARNLLMDLDDAGIRARFVLHDRDASFSAASGAVFQSAGITVIHSAVQAPRMNSIMERWIGSCRRELLDRTLIWNQRHLMIVLREYEGKYSVRPLRSWACERGFGWGGRLLTVPG